MITYLSQLWLMYLMGYDQWRKEVENSEAASLCIGASFIGEMLAVGSIGIICIIRKWIKGS